MSERLGDFLGAWLDRVRPHLVNEAASAAWEAEQARLVIERIGLPEDVRAAATTGLDSRGEPLIESAADKALARADAARKRLLVLTGAPGTGKTLAAARWLVRHAGGRYVLASEFSRAMCQAEWSKRANDLYDARERFRLASALVIDDAGENETPEKSAHLAELMRTRYDERRATVVTTNLGNKDFAERYGERVMTRLAEHGGSITLKTVLRPGASKLNVVKS